MEISPRKVAQVAVMARELDRAEDELRAFIDRMSEDEQAELVAIMWIGRESFDAEDFDEAVDTARAEASTPCADYLIGTPHLADHLENGLDALGISAEDEENDLM
jgi:light-regulated signal transduction histidine kinase (bacteriophytochrome)